MAVLRDSEALEHDFIKGLLDEPRYSFKGVKIHQIKSKFNKDTKKTESWRESLFDSSDLITDFRNAVLSHICSIQHGGQAKGEVETLQKSHFLSADSRKKKSSVSSFESIETGKQGVRRNIGYKLPQTQEKKFATQFQNPDNETLFFLHRNAQIQETPDNNIPYTINLWEFDSRDEFSAVNHSFLKAEALILYVMDISSDLFSPLKQLRGESNTNENSKTPAELLRHWLNLVHSNAKKQNLKPNIVFLLTHWGSRFAGEHNQYLENYIKTILDMVGGKPYATYITKENIILFNTRQDSLEDVRGNLFDRIRMQPSWGVKRPIRWLYLEAELLRRQKKSFLLMYDDERRPYLLVSEVKQLASAYGMDDCEVDSFIEFHHVLGDVIYCTLSNGERCIVTNPQWLMNRIGELVSPGPSDHYNLHFLQGNKGIVFNEDLQFIWHRFDAEFLIDIMISFGFILPLDNQKQTYLVQRMIPLEDRYKHEAELTYRAVYKANIDDILSVGTFHRLLSLCVQQSNWKLNIGGHLSHSDASFEVTKGTQLVITQKKDTIQVSTWTSKQELDKGQVSNDEIRAIVSDIHKYIAKNMEILGIEQSRTFRMLCPHWRPGDEFVCLVEMVQKSEPSTDRSTFVFYPKSEKCAIHNKTLEPRLFLRMDEYRKGV